MKCPKCAHLNPPDVKFCNDCGQMMGCVCSACHTVNLPHNKFCSQCGKVLSKTGAPGADDTFFKRRRSDGAGGAGSRGSAGERKHVTVLFSDMTGYTTLTQQLDPEEVRDILARIYHEITNIVAKYEGFIEKFAGDAVMAVFGATNAHEDDAIRAIIAAREIHERVAACGREYEQQAGHYLSMHSGIDTGLVVTGDVDDIKGTHGIAGAPLNIAARLCSLAAPGDILVGSETYRLSRGYFNFLPLAPAKLKGIDTPLPVYKVISLIDQPKKIHRFHGLRADLIGRHPELELLIEALDRVRAGQGRLVSIGGNAGTGKSRLVEEFKIFSTREKVNWREGQCYPYSRNFTYFPLIDLLNRTLDIKESDPPEIVRQKIESGLDFIEHKKDVVPYVGSLYNFDYPELARLNPETWRLRLQKAILEILTAMARRAPTIICLEDLHWADPSSLDLIRFLLSDFRYPALVICVYRPTLTLFSHQQTVNLGESFIDIRLEDLSPAETETMVGSLLKTDSLPLELKRFVREKAGGNPFYLEEIMNSLVESQALVPERDHWVLRKSIEESEISSTIHGVIAARIDRLEAEMKCILQEAAVIGRSFYQEILSHITEFKDNLWHHLSSLETLDIIKARSYRPAVEYIFKHALTQEVVYGGLVKDKRREIHEWVGRVIEHLFEDRLSEYYEALAYHFQRGRSLDKAADYLARSGEKSLARYALDVAQQYFQDAYACIEACSGAPEADSLKIDLLNKWSFVFYYRGRYKELLDLLERHQAAADGLAQREKRAMFYAWLGCALWHRERFKEAHRHLTTALALAEEIQDVAVAGYACCWLTWVSTELGLLGEAIGHAEKAQAIYAAGQTDDFIYFSSMAGMGYAFWHQGEKDRTLAAGRNLLDFGRRRSDYRATGMGYCCIGWGHLVAGDVSEATAFFEKAVQVSVDPWYSLFPKLALAFGLLLNGRVEDARHTIADIETFCDEFGVEFAGKPAHFFQGVVLVGEGRVEEGLTILEQSCGQWRENGSRLRFAACGSMLAAVYSDLTRHARAARHNELARQSDRKAASYFQSSIDLARQIGAKGTLAQAYRNWGNYYKDKGEIDKAKECFIEAVGYLRLCGSDILLRQVETEQSALTVGTEGETVKES
ncbi:MAG: AAA family ATPase [Desulfobacterales bacterium]